MLFDYFRNIEFAQPYFFALFALLPVLIFWYIKTNNSRSSSVRLSTVGAKGLGSWKASFRHLPFICRILCMAFLIIALAHPQTRYDDRQTEGEGIDIVLCIDVSGSMTAQDLTPNRLEAAKNVAVDFVNRRLTDRIGIVIFAGESFTQCPLTTDHGVLVAALQNINFGLLADGTAIGDGLSTGVDRLRNVKTPSKVIVLLTDGVNNSGLIPPDAAKEIAKAYGIKVYTIGVGTEGTTTQRVQTERGVETRDVKVSIDEKLLTQISAETGGRYFRATDNESLSGIYSTIDALEKTKVEITSTTRYTEKFLPFAAAAAFFLLLEILLRYLVFRKFP
ncbi:MAG: VWA domain-containing protein [Ferruginibacter sp.]